MSCGLLARNTVWKVVAFVLLKFSSVDAFLNGYQTPPGHEKKDELWEIPNIARKGTQLSIYHWTQLIHALQV